MRAALLLLLAACSARLGSEPVLDEEAPDGGTASGPDAAAEVDALVVAADNVCGVASVQGDLGSVTGDANVDPQGITADNIYSVSATSPLTTRAPAPDVVHVELWDGYGTFTGGKAKTGTFEITGVETDYDTCGVCVLVFADVTNDTPARMLLATTGTVTITSIGTAAGETTQVTVSNASFVEIALGPTGYDPVTDSSCTSPISNVALTGTI